MEGVMSTKERILDAALTLFAENGYDGTSVEQIANIVGIKAPSLYKHYKGKAAKYYQIELEVVADNIRALALYQRAGYVEYGRNPRGFLSRKIGWQETVLMRRELGC